jgi:hypothetical protein
MRFRQQFRGKAVCAERKANPDKGNCRRLKNPDYAANLPESDPCQRARNVCENNMAAEFVAREVQLPENVFRVALLPLLGLISQTTANKKCSANTVLFQQCGTLLASTQRNIIKS